MKRIISAILALVMLAFCFASCTTTGNGDGTTTGGQEDSTPTDSGSGTPEPPKSEGISIEELAKFSIVRPSGASTAIVDAMRDLQAKIKEVYGVELKVGDDFYREGDPMFPMGEFEIVLGASDRPETKEFLSEMRYNDYGYRLSGGRLVITGHTDDTVLKAVEKFTADFLSAKRDDGKFFTGEPYVFADKYACDGMTLNGAPIKDYTIIYKKSFSGGKTAAEALYWSVIDASGYVLDVVTNVPEGDGKLIEIGDAPSVTADMKTARDNFIASSAEASNPNKYYLAATEKGIWISADGLAGLCAAVQKLMASAKTEGALTAVSVEGERVGTFGDEEKFTVMSFNILTTKPDEARVDQVVTMILNNMPDTVGLQEASPYWMSCLKASDLMKYYDCVGVGRNGGNEGEYSAIFYKKDKFKLIDSGTKWLSSTPDTPNTKYDDSSYPRIMTYAVLEDKATGKQILHINTHLEHTKSAPREKQIKVLMKEAAKLGRYPTVVTGDFNDQRNSGVYNTITGKGYLDAALTAEKPDSGITFPKSSKVLDYVFYTPNAVYAKSFRVCSDKINGSYPSDHYPVFCEYCVY